MATPRRGIARWPSCGNPNWFASLAHANATSVDLQGVCGLLREVDAVADILNQPLTTAMSPGALFSEEASL